MEAQLVHGYRGLMNLCGIPTRFILGKLMTTDFSASLVYPPEFVNNHE